MEVWERMTKLQRAYVEASLPSEFEVNEASPPQGDAHFETMSWTVESLRTHFGKRGRRIYIGADKAVFYPGEQMFSPDVIAVLDVDDHPRNSWFVNKEGKGVDLCIEIVAHGWKAKDMVRNVDLYARLGIPEYFVFDLRNHVLKGYRLNEALGEYSPLFPKARRLRSEVLELDLVAEVDRLRFHTGSARVPFEKEIIAQLDEAVEQACKRVEEAVEREQEAIEASHAAIERERAAIERMKLEANRALAAEQRLAEALAELEALKRSRR